MMKNSILHPAITERRYADYPRRWLVEYHVDGREKLPTTKGRCATLSAARTNAARACDQGFCAVVRIFDSKIGQYHLTYKGRGDSLTRYEGNVK